MRKVLAVLLIASAASVVAVGSAGASKPPPDHWLCGPKGSVQLPNSIEGEVPFFAGTGQGRKAPPAAPQSFYRLSYDMSRSCAVTAAGGVAFFIPAAGEVRTVDSLSTQHALWVKLPAKLESRLRNLVAQVKPYPTPTKVPQVTVKAQFAARPSSYLRLYTIGTPTQSASSVKRWTGISLEGSYTPWTDGHDVLAVSSTGDYLKRDGQLVHIPASIATRIRHAQAIPK